MRRLIEAVINDPGRPWNEETRKQAVIDGNAILEALLLEYGVDAALTALVNQGYSPGGQYRYVVEPLFEKALERRDERMRRRRAPGGEPTAPE